jgi:hypothetical protein
VRVAALALDVRTSLAGFSSFLDGMGKVFGPVVALIVCAEFFAESLKAIGAIDTLLHSASNAGIGSGLMTLVMVGLIVVASVIMGSGNAAFLSFSTLAPAVAAKFGVPGGDHAAADAARLQHRPHRVADCGRADCLLGDREGLALRGGQAHQRADGRRPSDGPAAQLPAVHEVNAVSGDGAAWSDGASLHSAIRNCTSAPAAISRGSCP